MNVRLHIERVVVDARLAVDRAALEAAISAAVAARLDRQPPPPATDAWRRAPDVDLRREGAADALARAVAAAVIPGADR